ncbi:MAG TPA: class I SAM-dependent methyltransferase [Gemmatimonadales bacterium]|nr:class I SAM-dependent methyltransferase [Gemmatimonadales bacterium]
MRQWLSHRMIDRGARRWFALTDRVGYWRRILLTARGNRRFRAAHPDFAAPPLPILWDAQATTDLAEYKASGESAAAQYWALIRPHVTGAAAAAVRVPTGRPARVCEWGCGPARILRHLPSLAARGAAAGTAVEFYGSDYNRASIAWCRAHLTGISFLENGLAPPLPVPDGFFDLLFCRSVFTHLSAEMHGRWMAELARAVRPGGVVIVTTHGDAYRPRLTAEERARYDGGELIVRTLAAEGRKLFGAFHPPAWVRERLLAGLTLLEYQPGADTQDIWAARVPGAPA